MSSPPDGLMTENADMHVIDWLLDSDPSLRWQVMRDLTHEPADVVAAERSRIATEGWGARLLALQGRDVHRGETYFEMDDGDGQPSRWNTLRALRVLEWAGAVRHAAAEGIAT